MHWKKDKRIWLYLIVTLVVVNAAIAIFSLSHAMGFSFGHILFIPIIFTAFFYPRRGVLFALILGTLYVLINAVFVHDPLAWSRVFLEFALYVGIGGILSLFSENLVDEKNRYLCIFDTSEAAILLISKETLQIIESNPRFASLIGYPEAELKGAPVSRFWQGGEPFGRFIDRIQPGHPIVDYDVSLAARDGSVHDVLLSARARDVDDTVVLTLIDISERKKAQIALERSEERYRNVVEDQTEFISRFRPDGTHVFANEAYLRYFGLNREEVIGKKFAPALFPEDRERMQSHISSLTRENPAATIEHRIIMPDGSVRWQQWSDRAIFDDTGRLVEYQSVGRDITANKQAEEALAKSERLLSETLQASPVMKFVIDRQHRVIHWNRALEEYTGILARSIIGTSDHWKAFYDHQRPCMADLIVDGAVDALPTYYGGKFRKSPFLKDAYEATDRFLLPRRGETWLNFTAAPIRDSEGHVTGAQETLTDITEQKRAEEDLKKSEERYRNVVEDQTEFISRFLPDGTHVFANEAYLRYFGKTREEIIGHRFTLEIPPEDRIRLRAHLASLTADHPVATIKHRIIMPDGSVRWQQWADRAIFDHEGRTVEYQSVGRDITANKQAEEALAKSEEKLRTVVENVPDFILVHRDGILLYANPAATRVMEYTPDELLNTHFTAYIAPEYLSRVAAAMQKRMAGEPVEPYEIEVITKSGGHRTVLVSGSRIDYVGGPASLNVLTDVTERIRYENSLRTSLREKEVLLKEVHHRVKNNMQVISSLLSLQANSIRDPTDLVYFQECERRVRAMALVHEKLYQSKDLSGVSARDYLGSLVNDLVATYSLAAEIRIQLEMEEIPLDLDMAIPCGLIVNELVTNALKYAFKGRNRGVLTVEMARVPEHRYTLTVQDDGIGFPPDLDLSKAETLGLKLVWVLSHQLDGDVRVESGPGTRFVITFPEKVR
jgi:PAS domain S-box-containing protein